MLTWLKQILGIKRLEDWLFNVNLRLTSHEDEIRMIKEKMQEFHPPESGNS